RLLLLRRRRRPSAGRSGGLPEGDPGRALTPEPAGAARAAAPAGRSCHRGRMTVEVRPASQFEDVRALLGPKSPQANVCWCLSYRIPSKLNRELRGPARGEYVAELLRSGTPLGVLAYEDGEPVGWAAVAPRADTSFARNRKIPHVDDLPVWSLWCIRVRPGHRGKGLSHALIAGAVAYARAQGAPAVEAYP